MSNAVTPDDRMPSAPFGFGNRFAFAVAVFFFSFFFSSFHRSIETCTMVVSEFRQEMVNGSRALGILFPIISFRPNG